MGLATLSCPGLRLSELFILAAEHAPKVVEASLGFRVSGLGFRV